MSNTLQATEDRVVATQAEVVERKEVKPSEICFGAVMAVGALYGLWASVSFLIKYFVAG